MDEHIRRYLATIGRRGGKSCSPAKVAAAQQNAKKAGRPRGSKNKPKPGRDSQLVRDEYSQE